MSQETSGGSPGSRPVRVQSMNGPLGFSHVSSETTVSLLSKASCTWSCITKKEELERNSKLAKFPTSSHLAKTKTAGGSTLLILASQRRFQNNVTSQCDKHCIWSMLRPLHSGDFGSSVSSLCFCVTTCLPAHYHIVALVSASLPHAVCTLLPHRSLSIRQPYLLSTAATADCTWQITRSGDLRFFVLPVAREKCSISTSNLSKQ